jgi:hypothetical protein
MGHLDSLGSAAYNDVGDGEEAPPRGITDEMTGEFEWYFDCDVMRGDRFNATEEIGRACCRLAGTVKPSAITTDTPNRSVRIEMVK